ncbi:hypothetical protein KEM09_21625 [Carboxylicivirga mesophila]|uniref:Uncharacterized protein n=1 Tax=Carboxylicivirga mesophila TaxID=1166478 RepID=A0ABS5KJG7_9BACT|nr:DUF6266 family protein [Carboxylicivirga mesophila]MBS2214023.1 hypothetical protein [Carboxylicivirga mesophila]
MGRFIKGIMGGFSGKVGNIVGGNWRGISYMRSLSERRNYTPTEKQLMQRARFAYAVSFLQPIHPVVRVGYRNQASQQSPLNAALAHVLKKVVEGEYPDYRINYASLEMAKGLLPGPQHPAVQLQDQTLTFTWRDGAAILKDYGDNQVLLLAIGDGIYPSYSIGEAVRNDGQATLAIPDAQTGTVLHTYLAFLAVNGNSVSNSYYVGEVSL